MNLLLDAIKWLNSDLTGVDQISTALLAHLGYTFVSVAIAAVFAIPLGWWIGHTGRGKDLIVALSAGGRSVPSFGLLVLLVLLFGVARKPEAAVLSYALLAFAAILSGAYAGVSAAPRDVVDASRAVGMSEWQILTRTEIPLGLPLLVAGIRSALLQVVATVTIGAYVGLGGLGQYIIAGIPLRRFDMVLGGAILVTGLALVLDAVFAVIQRLTAPTITASAPAAHSDLVPHSDQGE